ncbi:MAG: hypothetical protein EAZ06_00420 [Cytophagales bacterium]|nr:MAG: hypothetical protein EAZ06_00420 [Cytophagales bacterium]
MYRSLFLIITIFLFQAISFAQSPLITVQGQWDLHLIGKQIMFLEDTTGKLTIQQIQQPNYQAKFQRNKKNIFQKPASRNSYWFKIVIANHTKEKIWLDIESITPWYLELYAMDSAGKYQKTVETGSLRPYSTRAYPTNTFWLPLNPAGTPEAMTYYFCIKSERILKLPMYVGSINALQQHKINEHIIIFIFTGLILMMFLYNLFLYVTVGDWVYLIYLGNIFTNFLSIAYLNNYPVFGIITFIPSHIWHTHQYVWFAFTTLFSALFVTFLLELYKSDRLFFYVLAVFVFLNCFLLPILNIFFFSVVDLNRIELIASTLFYLVCLTIGIRSYFKKVNNSFYYLWGWGFAILGLIINILLLQEILPYNILTSHALILGSVIELSLFSIALGNRINILKKSNTLISIEKTYLDKLNKDLLTQQTEIESKNIDLAVMNEELRANTESLAELNQTKDKLFSIIGHDLRAPIGSLKGLLYLLLAESISKEEFLKFSTRLKQNIEVVHNTLENLLYWANSQMEGEIYTPTHLHLKAIVQEKIRLYCELLASKQIQISDEINEMLYIWSDENQVKLIIHNLISNAIKFTPTNGYIRITAEKTAGFCAISVIDTGIGMSEEKVQRLFQHKTNISTRGTEGEKGTGLGLMLCQEMVEKNGGYIKATSEIGKGTTITFSLPTT